MPRPEPGLPIEQFIQALTSQLDRAQHAMALKAKAGIPLTFAVRDLALDLKAHVDMAGSVVRIRPAGPGEGDASHIRLELTTVTRPMIEENTFAVEADEGEPTLDEAVGEELSPEEQRRLEWAGVHTVRQLLDLRRKGGDRELQRLVDVPAARLRAALDRAGRPLIRGVEPVYDGPHPPAGVRIRNGLIPAEPDPGIRTRPGNGDPRVPPGVEGWVRHDRPEFLPGFVGRIRHEGPEIPPEARGGRPGPAMEPPEVRIPPGESPGIRLPEETVPRMRVREPEPPMVRDPRIEMARIPKLRIRGNNLVGEVMPEVRVGGEPVRVLEARASEIIIQPEEHQLAGALEIRRDQSALAAAAFDLSELAPAPREAPPTPPSGEEQDFGSVPDPAGGEAEPPTPAPHRTGEAAHPRTPAPHRTGVDPHPRTPAPHRTGVDAHATSPTPSPGETEPRPEPSPMDGPAGRDPWRLQEEDGP